MIPAPLRCLVVDDEAFSRTILELYIDRHDALTLVASCASAIEAINILHREDLDLIFLDVEMPEMTGLDLARSMTQGPQIILVTSKEEYALEAFNIEVIDYLLKPVDYVRFLKAVERVLKRSETKDMPEDDFVFVRSEGRLIKVELHHIQWIEAQREYMKIQTQGESYVVHGTMKDMVKKLPSRAFMRVHRSFIVRTDRIADIEDNSLVIGRKVIPIGASYKASLIKRLKML